jgi:hypothetical protein
MEFQVLRVMLENKVRKGNLAVLEVPAHRERKAILVIPEQLETPAYRESKVKEEILVITENLVLLEHREVPEKMDLMGNQERKDLKVTLERQV